MTGTSNLVDKKIDGVEERLDDLEKSTFGTAKSLSGYSSNNPYVCPSDGYVIAYAYSSGTAFLQLVANGKNMFSVTPINAHSCYMGTYVKKGMSLYYTTTDANTSAASFYPLT